MTSAAVAAAAAPATGAFRARARDRLTRLAAERAAASVAGLPSDVRPCCCLVTYLAPPCGRQQPAGLAGWVLSKIDEERSEKGGVMKMRRTVGISCVVLRHGGPGNTGGHVC
jgi:hypothetical protein